MTRIIEQGRERQGRGAGERRETPTGRSPFASRSLGPAAPGFGSGGRGTDLGSGANAALDAASAGGRRLPTALRGPFEAAFGRSFGLVRVHDDAQADAMSRAFKAQAFAYGPHIFLRGDAPPLESPAGQEILAHELAHVAQGAGAPEPGLVAPAPLRLSEPGEPAERAADASAAAFRAGGTVPSQAPAPPGVVHRVIELRPTGVIDAADGEDEIFRLVVRGDKRKEDFDEDGHDDDPGPRKHHRRDSSGGGGSDSGAAGMPDAPMKPYQIMSFASSHSPQAVMDLAEQVLPVQASRPGAAAEESLVLPPGFLDGIAALQQGGEPLPPAVQAEMAQRFRHDFSAVRVHADEASDALARTIDARAFTVGNRVFFGSGRWSPRTLSGQALLAHELTHVVQQGRGGRDRSDAAPRASGPTEVAEREAFRVQSAVRAGLPQPPVTAAPSFAAVAQRHPGYGGAHPPNVAATAQHGKIANVPPHANVLRGLKAWKNPAFHGDCVAELDWPGAIQLAPGWVPHRDAAANWTKNTNRPATGSVIHRVNAKKIRNPAVTAAYAKLPGVVAFTALYAMMTGYGGKWNMHHIWPLAWHGDDTPANLSPVPTTAGGVAHQTHGQWHKTLKTSTLGQPGPKANILPPRQYPAKIGAHFKAKRL